MDNCGTKIEVIMLWLRALFHQIFYFSISNNVIYQCVSGNYNCSLQFAKKMFSHSLY